MRLWPDDRGSCAERILSVACASTAQEARTAQLAPHELLEPTTASCGPSLPSRATRAGRALELGDDRRERRGDRRQGGCERQRSTVNDERAPPRRPPRPRPT